MIRRIVLSALVLAGAFLAGCASGPKFSEVSSSILPIPAAEGRIYFFRSSSMMGAALQPDIRLDGEVVGSSKPGGFFYVDRPAGSYTAAAATETEKTITFDLAAGETKYLRTSRTTPSSRHLSKASARRWPAIVMCSNSSTRSPSGATETIGP